MWLATVSNTHIHRPDPWSSFWRRTDHWKSLCIIKEYYGRCSQRKEMLREDSRQRISIIPFLSLFSLFSHCLYIDWRIPGTNPLHQKDKHGVQSIYSLTYPYLLRTINRSFLTPFPWSVFVCCLCMLSPSLTSQYSLWVGPKATVLFSLCKKWFSHMQQRILFFSYSLSPCHQLVKVMVWPTNLLREEDWKSLKD